MQGTGRRYGLDNLANPNRDRPNLTYEFLGVTRVWRWTRERMEREYQHGRFVQTKQGPVPRASAIWTKEEERRSTPFGMTFRGYK